MNTCWTRTRTQAELFGISSSFRVEVLIQGSPQSLFTWGKAETAYPAGKGARE